MLLLVVESAVAPVAVVLGVEDDVGLGADREVAHVISSGGVLVVVQVENPARLLGSFEDQGIEGRG